MTLRTAEAPLGAYDQMVTIHTSDPLAPTVTVHVVGTIAAATGDTAGGSTRPLDWPVPVQGPKNQGEWVEFTHTLGPEPQSLHPVKVYSQDYATMYGVGKYATDFGQGTASYDMFGDGRDGVMPSSGNLDDNQRLRNCDLSTVVTPVDQHQRYRCLPAGASTRAMSC